MVSTSLQERMGLKLPKPENLGLALLKRRGHARDGQPRGCHTEQASGGDDWICRHYSLLLLNVLNGWTPQAV
jgi:hypothetical protein